MSSEAFWASFAQSLNFAQKPFFFSKSLVIPIEPLVFPIEVWLKAGQTFKEPTVTYCALNASTASQLVKLELS